MNIHPTEVQFNKPHSTYLLVEMGTIKETAELLYEQLHKSGYALLLTDILGICLSETMNYAAWAVLESQKNELGYPYIHQDTMLHGYEWAMIEMVIRAHCDLLQARMMEATRSLGGDGFGMTVSEAQSNYVQEREKLQKLASYEPPFSFKTLGGL